jgi:hypothetical protein
MRIWKLIAHHDQPKEAFDRFCRLGTIAIGWTDVGDLRKLKPQSASDITRTIQRVYPELNNAHLGGPSLWNFFRNVQPGDHVLVAGQGKRRGVFEVLGSYAFVPSEQAVLGYSHLRAATLTDVDPDGLWEACGRRTADGHAVRWTMALLEETEQSRQTIYQEGARYSLLVTASERNPQARAECLAHHGAVCKVCGFSGEKMFGPDGKGLIHVHHVKEVSTQSGTYNIDSINELVPLCPTCHAMAHRRKPAFTVAELKQKRLRSSTGT